MILVYIYTLKKYTNTYIYTHTHTHTHTTPHTHTHTQHTHTTHSKMRDWGIYKRMHGYFNTKIYPQSKYIFIFCLKKTRNFEIVFHNKILFSLITAHQMDFLIMYVCVCVHIYIYIIYIYIYYNIYIYIKSM